ncbi:MAG: hypothetical protein AAGA85_16190 [Bacteroidota bacterium]
MERYNPLIRILLAGALCVLLLQAFSQDQTIAINTTSPNANAVLHLHAPNGDQGLLVPTLSATQREAMALSTQDNGLLVYDTDSNVFYYWNAPSWIALSITDNQRLTLDGNTLSIDNGNEVDLSVIVPTPPIAQDVAYTADSSELSATTVQEAIDALDKRLDDGDLTAISAANEVSFDSVYSSLDANTVQGAIDRIDDRLDDLRGSQVDFNDNQTSIDARNVQEAIVELDEAIAQVSSSGSYIIDQNSNHLLGDIDGIPDGENNVLLANASGEGGVTPGSFNLVMGHEASVVATNIGGMAIGPGTFVDGHRGVAFGAGAEVQGENAIALGSETEALIDNTIILGDGINSPNYHLGINVQDPKTPLQVGDHLGFFHFNGTNSQGPIIGEAMSDDVFPIGNELYTRTANAPSSILFMRNGSIQFLTVEGNPTPTNALDLDVDISPTLLVQPDTTTVYASLKVGNTIQLGPHNTGGGNTPEGGLLEFNGNLKVHDGVTWRDVALKPSAVAPALTTIPGDGKLTTLPDGEYYPVEYSTSNPLTELPVGYPGQKITLVNAGANDLLVIDYADGTNNGINIDLQGAPTIPISFNEGSSLQLVYDVYLSRWVEVSRAINGGI